MNFPNDAQRQPARPLCRAVVAGFIALLLAGGGNPVMAAEPAATSTEQGATPADQADLANPQPGQALAPAPVAADKKIPFFDDSRISAQARTYYLYRDKYDNTNSEAWAIGGSISYTSGYVADLLRIGGVAYTSQPLYAPDERDGTLLLAPGQEGYTVLGQIYAEAKFTDQLFGALGRKEYNTPYLNKNDSRMTPNTFEGVTVYGSAGAKGSPEWKFGGGYITKIKERNSDEFKWLSIDAGSATTVERGVYAAGVNYKQKDLSIGAWEYYSDDIISIFYTEAIYATTAGNNKLKLSAQYTDQQSTGDNLLTGSEFSTAQWGVKADLSLGAAMLTLAYTDNTGDQDIRNPWSGHPGYTSVQVQDFYRANESALMLRGSYDFTGMGMKGVSAYALWVHGSGVAAPRYNEDEYDFNLQWTPDKASALRGMSFRLRYALIQQDGGGDPDINDFRVIVNYDFPRP